MNPESDPRQTRKVSVKRRAADPGTVTSTAAGAAIQQAVERRDRGRRNAAPERGAGATRPVRTVPGGAPTALTLVRVGAVVGLVAVLWQALVGFASWRPVGGDPAACAFAGRVTLDGTPLSQAVIELHPLEGGSGGTPVTVEADDTGGFARPASAGIAPGRYAVVVRSGCLLPRPGAEFGAPVVIPSRYARPGSSPLQVVVSGSTRLDVALRR